MRSVPTHCQGHAATHVVHHVVCRHQIEVEVWPARAEVNFSDERSVNPVNTQARFEAVLYNAPSSRVTWEVRNLAGDPGAGSIDSVGLYRAPPKGSLPNGFTDIVVATAVDDPLRKAFAWVTLVGKGPWPAPQPTIEIWPKKAYLYYPQNLLLDHRNELIDDSNKQQLFQAKWRNSPTSEVEWLVDNALQATTAPWFLYQVTMAGSAEVTVTARIKSQPSIRDQAKVLKIHYTWPKMRNVTQL